MKNLMKIKDDFGNNMGRNSDEDNIKYMYFRCVGISPTIMINTTGNL